MTQQTDSTQSTNNPDIADQVIQILQSDASDEDKSTAMLQQNPLPNFDPAWDYATIYEMVNDASNALIRALNHMSQQENATAIDDGILIAIIEESQRSLTTTQQLLNIESDFDEKK